MLTKHETLQEFRTALRRLNPKRLGRGAYVNYIVGGRGCMCSAGALYAHSLTRNAFLPTEFHHIFVMNFLDIIGNRFDPETVSAIIRTNDAFEGTPEERYEYMRNWVEVALTLDGEDHVD